VWLFCVLVLCGQSMHVAPCPEFELYDAHGALISNTSFEYREQELLCEHVRKGDHVLQMGGNIGTSCILTDMLGARTYCVEPQQALLDTLARNCRGSDVRIIPGVVDAEHESVHVVGDGVGAHTEGSGSVKAHRLTDILNPDDLQVLFMDCEGCAPRFLQQYPVDSLRSLRSIIYERDRLPSHEYDAMEAELSKSGWRCEGGFHRACTKA